MAKLLYGKPVADAIYKRIDESHKVACLLLVRAGEDLPSVSYEKMIVKKAAEHNISVKQLHFSEDVDEDDFFENLDLATRDVEVDGFLIFQPLPAQIDVGLLKKFLAPDKDVDCISCGSMAKLYTEKMMKFMPSTVLSVIEMLNFYDIDVRGKNVVVVGRSEVVGKPLAHVLTNRDATVTLAHSKTRNLRDVTSRADVVILATGQANAFDETFFSEGQVVIDVGVNVGLDGKITGDVDFDRVEPKVGAITPVPNGVGSITTATLLFSVIRVSKKQTS